MHVLQRILALIVKELIMILRDPKSRFIVIGPPLIQFFVFGYAATFDVTQVRFAVLDQAHTVESRQLVADFQGSDNFRLTQTLTSTDQIDEVINTQTARMVLHIGPDFSRKLAAGQATDVQVLFDGRNSNVASVALGYTRAIVRNFSEKLMEGQPERAGPVLQIEDRAWFNSNLESRWYIVSALGGIISMVVVMVLTSLSVAREREFGTFDQLLVAPFTSGEILLAKSVPGLLFGLIDSLLLSAAGVWWFEVPFRGSLPALVMTLTVFMISIVGIGLLISSLATTMQQALLGSFVFIMPAVILSGFTTPIENMPRWLQTGTYINPLRYVVKALREIFLAGAGMTDIWPLLWPLGIIACLTLPPAAWLFKHRTT